MEGNTITINDFKQVLREDYGTKFQYTKKDGTTRVANGTLNFDSIPEKDIPKGANQDPDKVPVETSLVTYYDLDKAAWRSFDFDNFLGLL